MKLAALAALLHGLNGLVQAHAVVSYLFAAERKNSLGLDNTFFFGKPQVVQDGDLPSSWGANETETRQVNVENFACHEVNKARSTSKKNDLCPEACPYWAQEKKDDLHCTFKCVLAEECAVNNPRRPIADAKLGICRAPMVQNCDEYLLDGTDRCTKCQSGYKLSPDGRCHFIDVIWWSIVGIVTTLVILLVVLITWVVDMACRPVTNQVQLDLAMAQRELSKLHHVPPKDVDTDGQIGIGFAGHEGVHQQRQDELKPWPITTNLCREDVAGPGIILYFNFQVAVMVWALLVAALWACLGFVIDSNLFILGTRKFGTPRSNCILVAWGYETQQELMWVKIMFLYIVYFSSVFLAFLHGVRQLRIFESVDNDRATMRDYALQITGLPPMNGIDRVEEKLKSLVAEYTGENVVGVSVAWNFDDIAEDVIQAIAQQHKRLEGSNTSGSEDAEEDSATSSSLSSVRAKLNKAELTIFGGEPAEDEEVSKDRVHLMLCELKTSDLSFAIFETEESRQRAFSKARTNEVLMIDGRPVKLTVPHCEVCARVAESIGYRFTDHKEACYMLLYLFACTCNILLDMVTTYFMAWQIMSLQGFRNYAGVRLTKINMFPEGIETYAIQRALAENVKAYAFPSTYLIPFLLEPIPTIIAPLVIGKLIVRCHKEIHGSTAEEWVAAVPWDMGRYADILLNVVLAILIFYFPGGYTTFLFLALFFSHIWIYAFDHYRLLRVVPSCTFASITIDWCSQLMLAPCCGLILSCIVFKINTQDSTPSLDARGTVVACFVGFWLHCIVHVLLLIYLVPIFGIKHDRVAQNPTYAEVGSRTPASWFSTNPVHCLRSEFVYEHNPPCVAYKPGREDLLMVNKEIGCHFKIHYEAPIDEEQDEGSPISKAKSRLFRAQSQVF